MAVKHWMIGGSVFVAAVGGFLLDTLIDGGAFREITPHYHGECATISNVVGVEDITIDHTSGFAYLSAHDRRNFDQNGQIYVYRPGSLATPLPLAHDFNGQFRPHGISIWLDDAGPDRLFVINHPDGAKVGERLSTVELFEIGAGKLTHIRTVHPEAAYSLNDIAATGPDSFYATIDKGSETKMGRMLEGYGRLARGGIAYGSGDSMRRVAGDLTYPNGVQWDGARLYVAETTGERLVAFEQTGPEGTLKQVAETRIDSGLDNLEWDTDGNLWIGAHPAAVKFPAHGKDAANRSPSQVLKVSLTPDGFDVLEVYLNDGNPLSGSSVAAPHLNRLLIGSVFEPFILDCSL